MEFQIEQLDQDTDELRDLYRELTNEPAVTAVREVITPVPEGSLGGELIGLIVQSLPEAGAVGALLMAWVQSRRARLRLTVRREGNAQTLMVDATGDLTATEIESFLDSARRLIEADATPATATSARRGLCIAFDIRRWSDRLVPEQLRAQQALETVIRTACAEAWLPQEFAQVNGDGVLLLPPSGIDETQTIPRLIHGLRTALHQENRLLAKASQIRLRMSLTEGTITPGPTGVGGIAVVECFRLLQSPPLTQALEDHPAADLVVIVSDHLYHDVIKHSFHDLRAAEFHQITCSIPEKNFHQQAWLYIPVPST